MTPNLDKLVKESEEREATALKLVSWGNVAEILRDDLPRFRRIVQVAVKALGEMGKHHAQEQFDVARAAITEIEAIARGDGE